ncbi:App1 family protein [Sphingomonas sp.]|jgi:phosphatidate phosphatase APP1|uniref:App1 family protein n=1 Tax=Sphingomonas sp. TaxID=28214 RepID=UPI002DF2A268|nr:phosphatase domain-containing protein [Sphingomonas sp.]HEV2568928.1 phosphatase domain-containing protein [Sphingomonas sp.]
MTASSLLRLLAGIEGALDRLGSTLGRHHRCEVRLLAYAGYRTETRLHLKGRVVRAAPTLTPGAGTWSRMRAMLAIYNSRELAGVPVQLQAYGETHETVTDQEGYFHFDKPVAQPLPKATSWEKVTLTTPGRTSATPQVSAPMLAPGANNNWGIISDIDDTVVETGATNFVRNWRRVLVERPSDRLAVPGASALYRMIAVDHRAPARPFFYVSSSPWNLYGFLTEFMELNGIPHGPMFLKDYGLDADKLIDSGHETHKLLAIETILAAYPKLRFLLIGDNGQKDVTIYAQVVKDFGPRVAAVFIRDVDGSCRSGPEGTLLRAIEAAGVPTFCGAGFDDALAVVEKLDLDRPVEAAKAVIAPFQAPDLLVPSPSPPPVGGAQGSGRADKSMF